MYISLWKNLYLFQILSMLQWWSHINFLLIIRVLMMTRIGAVDGRDDDASRGCSGWYVVTAVSTEVLVITAEDNGSGGAGCIDRAAGGVTRWWHYAGGYHGDTLDVILPMRVMCTNKCTSHLLTDTHPGRMLVFHMARGLVPPLGNPTATIKSETTWGPSLRWSPGRGLDRAAAAPCSATLSHCTSTRRGSSIKYKCIIRDIYLRWTVLGASRTWDASHLMINRDFICCLHGFLFLPCLVHFWRRTEEKCTVS